MPGPGLSMRAEADDANAPKDATARTLISSVRFMSLPSGLCVSQSASIASEALAELANGKTRKHDG